MLLLLTELPIPGPIPIVIIIEFLSPISFLGSLCADITPVDLGEDITDADREAHQQLLGALMAMGGDALAGRVIAEQRFQPEAWSYLRDLGDQEAFYGDEELRCYEMEKGAPFIRCERSLLFVACVAHGVRWQIAALLCGSVTAMPTSMNGDTWDRVLLECLLCMPGRLKIGDDDLTASAYVLMIVMHEVVLTETSAGSIVQDRMETTQQVVRMFRLSVMTGVSIYELLAESITIINTAVLISDHLIALCFITGNCRLVGGVE